MNLKNKEFSRSFLLQREAVNEEARTVDLAFSSEQPVERAFGYEVLDHNPESVRMDRLVDGAPLLVGHNMDDQVGVIERASIDEDRVGRVVVRFGNSERANEIFRDVVDGIRRHVSVGYRIFDARLDKRASDDGELDTYRITDWMPFEVSIVSVPADASVGIGRSLDSTESQQISKVSKMTDQVNQPVEEQAKPQIDEAAIRASVLADVQASERQRVADILSIGASFSKQDMARNYIEKGASVDDFRKDLLAQMEATTVRENPETHLDLSEKEVKQYSLIRAIAASISGNWKDAGFEAECSREIAERLGKDPKGFFMPYDVMNRATPMTVGAAADGGYLKGTDHLAGSFIDNLRASSVILGSGARVLDGLVGDVSIPKKVTSAGFNWLAEDANQIDDQVVLGTVAMSPKTIGGAVPMSRKLLKQSAPSVDAIVLEDLITGAALAIDSAAISGTGASGQPLGILNQTGVLTQTVADIGNIPTFAEAVGFETKLAEQNALNGALRYLTTPAISGSLKTTAKDAGSGLFLVENNMLNGYGVTATTQMPAGRTLFGNFNDVLIGMWGVLDVYADTSTKAASGGLVIRVFQDVDVAIRHAQSFCMDA